LESRGVVKVFCIAPGTWYGSLYKGNKWGVIEKKMEGKTDNCLKNKFYSTVRKGFRKLNNYIANIKRKRSHPLLSENKLLKPEFITKLIAVADKNF
jgi:DNA-binding PadR family transcriptional regulator